MSALLSGLLGAGGSLIQGLFGQSSAQASMDFQREVLQNRNQWMVQDLRKAGLNPILAAGATSSGSALGAQAHIDNPGEKAVSSAMQYKMAQIQYKMADIAKDKLITEQREAESRINLNNALGTKAIAEANAVLPEMKLTSAKTAESLASAENLGSSALVNYENVKVAQAKVVEIHGQVSKLAADIRRSEAERRHIIEQIKVARTQAAKNALEADLTKANIKLTRHAEVGKRLANMGIQIDNQIKGLGLQKSIAESDYYGSTLGRYFHMFEKIVDSISPLK